MSAARPLHLEAQLLELINLDRLRKLGITPAQFAAFVAPSASRCGCCGARAGLRHFVLYDLRLWCSCQTCVDKCEHCIKHLKSATPVPL